MATVNVGTVEAILRLRDELSPALKVAGQRMTEAGKKMTQTGRSLLPLSAAVGAVGIAALKMGMDFNKGMSEVATLLPGNIDRINELKAGVQDMARETGKSTGDLTAGLYQTVSAFQDLDVVTGRAGETIRVLEINAKAAQAGMADTEDAIRLTSAVTKGYGVVTAETVQKAADLAFMTVKLGQTTFPELAGSIGRVVPIAASLGVKQEELFAGFGTLTGVIGDAAETSTGFRAAMIGLLKPTEAMQSAMGKLEITNLKAKIEQDGLINTMRELIATTDGSTESVAQLWNNVRALPTVLALAGGQAENFNMKLKEFANFSGAAAEANKEVTQGVNAAGHAWNQLKQEVVVAAQKLGDVMLPMLLNAVTAIKPMIAALMEAITWFDKLPGPVKTAVVVLGAVVTASAPFLIAMGMMTTAVGTMATAIGTTGAGLIGALGTLGLALAAGWLAYEFMTWLRETYPAVEKTTDVIGDMILEVQGLGVALRAYNEYISQSRAGTENMTAAELKLHEAWVAGTAARAAAGEAQAKILAQNTEEQSGAVALLATINDLARGSLDLAAAKDVQAAAQKAAFALTDAGVIAAVRASEAEAALKAASELTGQAVENEAQALHILAVAAANTKEALAAVAEEQRRLAIEAEELTEHLKKEASAVGFVLDKLKPLTKAGSAGSITDAAQQAYELGSNLAEAALKGGASIDTIRGKLAGMGLDTREVDDIIALLPEKLADAEVEGFDFAKSLEIAADAAAILGDTGLGGLIGDMIVGTQQAFAMAQEIKAAVKEAGGFSKMDFGSKVGAVGAMAGTAKGIWDKNKKNLSAGGAAMSGAAQGAAAGSAFGPWGAAIGAVGGALIGFFAGKKFRKIAKDAGKVLGTELSQETVEAIEATMADLDLSASEAALLHIGDAIEDSGKKASEFADQMLDLMDAVGDGTIPLAEGVEAIGESFSLLAEEAKQAGDLASDAMLDMIAKSRELGLEIPEVTAYIEENLNMAVAGLAKFVNALAFVSEEALPELGETAGVVFGAVFNALVSEQGIVAAVDQMGESFAALRENLLETLGPEMTATILGPFGGAFQTLQDENLRPLFEGIDGLTMAMQGLFNAGFLNIDQFTAMQQAAATLYDELIAGGANSAVALLAIAPNIQAAIDAANRFGVPLDEDTQRLKELAEQNGITFSTDPMDAMLDVLVAIAEVLGADLPAAADRAATAIGNIPSPPSVPRHTPSEPDVGAQHGFFSPSMPSGPRAGGGTDIRVHPGEEVSVSPAGSGAGGGPVVNLHINENQMQTAESRRAMRDFSVRSVEEKLASHLAELVESGGA